MTESTTPESEGLPDTADDTSSAYDDPNHPRLAESPPALPTDEPQGVDEFGVTPEEARRGESLSARLVREEPDESIDAQGADRPVGRLVEPDQGLREDDEDQAIAYDSGETKGLSAEEAAVHVIPDES